MTDTATARGSSRGPAAYLAGVVIILLGLTALIEGLIITGTAAVLLGFAFFPVTWRLTSTVLGWRVPFFLRAAIIALMIVAVISIADAEGSRASSVRAQAQAEEFQASFRENPDSVLTSLAMLARSGKYEELLARSEHWTGMEEDTLRRLRRLAEETVNTRRETARILEERRRERPTAVDRRPVPDRSGVYPEVRTYLRRVAHDPSSVRIVQCTEARRVEESWVVGCEYRARNAFGAYVLTQDYFVIRRGVVVGTL